MKKIIIVLAVSLMSIISFAEARVGWVASSYKGILELKVELGQQVKKDQLVFQLNLDALLAEKKTKEETLKFNQLIVERAKKLVKTHSISLEDYQECIRDLTVAQADLKITEASIALSKYYAPFDGTVTQIVRYNGGLGDNDNQVQITEGNVKVDTANRVAMCCTFWEGILEIKVKEGQKVKKGDMLFTINTDDLKAQLEMDEAKLKYATILYDREKTLHKTATVSLYKYRSAKNNYEKALLEAAQTKITLKRCPGYAPFDGTVTKFYNRYDGSGNGRGKPVVDITASQ